MILELKNVSKSFGAVTVTDSIDLAVRPGEAVGVIGPNGAGKTTLFNLINGGLRPDSGEVWLNGENVTNQSAQARCLKGIGRSHQVPLPFADLTVFENLLVGATFGQDKSESDVTEECAEVLETTGLMKVANEPAGSLTLLQRKRLEMARALATAPKLLLLDEIAGGLTEGECKALVQSVKDVHERGTTIIWIEHVTHALMAVVDSIFVLNFGKKIREGDPEAVMNSPEVQEIYMGISV